MGTVRVPRDIKKVKPKFLGPLNKRQTYTMAIGIGLGVAGYYASKPYIGASNAIFVLMAIMLPITFCGLFEKDKEVLGIDSDGESSSKLRKENDWLKKLWK